MRGSKKKKKKKNSARKKKIFEFSDILPAVVETVPEGIVILDERGSIVFANFTAQKILGLKRPNIPEKKYNAASWKIFDLNGRPIPFYKLPFFVVKRQKKPVFDYRHFIKPAGKKKILLSINAAPIRGEKRKFLGVAASVTDITARAEEREQLLEEKDRAQRYLDTAGTIFVVLDREGRVSLINRKGCTLLGYKKESSVIGRNWFDEFVPRRNRMKVKKEFYRLISGKISGEDYYENSVLTKKSGERLILWHNVILRDKKGGITGTLSSGEDITERKYYEKKLSESEEKYRALFEAFSDPVFVCELSGKRKVLEANEAACRSLGYTKKELLRLKLADFDKNFILDGKKEEKERKKIKSRKHNIIYGEHIRKDGKCFPVEVSGRLIDYNGTPAVLSVIRDITQRKKEEQKKEAANRYNRAKADIWELASDKGVSGEDLIRRAVAFAGPALDVDRVSYNVLKKDKYTCETEWSAKGVKSTVGVSLNYFVGKYLMKKNGLLLTPENIYSYIPRGLKAAANPVVKKIRKAIDAESVLLIPFDEADYKGSFSFDVCAGSGKSWSEEKRNTALDIVRIIEQAISRRKTQKILEESERKYRELFENANDAVFLNKFNNDGSAGGFIEANRAARKMTGKDIKKLRKMTPADTVSKECLDNFKRVGKKLLEKGSFVYESRIKPVKGMPVEVEVSSHVFSQGEKKVVLSIMRDITRRKAAEQAIKDSEEKFRKLAETTGVGIVMFDKKRKIIYANKYAKITMGYRERELRGKDIMKFIHPDFRKRTAERFVKRIEGHKKLPNFELQVLTGSGKCRWFDYRGALINYEGEPAVLGTFIYIDERKRFEQALVESEEKFRTISEQSAQGVAIVQGEKVKYINKAFGKIHEADPKELRKEGQKGLLKFIHPDDKVRAINEINSPFLPGKTKKHQFRIITSGGKVRWVESYAKKINYEGDRANFVTVVNITSLKKAEKELVDTVNELKRSNEELQNFAYVASHDLQEPLRMVSSYVQLLQRRFGNRMGPDADEFIGYAVEGAERMRKLINDLLEYSRIGTRGREFSRVDINGVIEDVERNLGNVIEKKEAEIIKEGLPVINADEVQMIQLFQNLISNAIKFAKKGEKPVVKITAKKKGNKWLFSVEDNGIGIKKEYFSKIFDIFQRLHGKEEYSGTGIGLTICRKIIERHQGNIWVRSAAGKGTVFYFTIPEK